MSVQVAPQVQLKHRELGLNDEQALDMYWHILLARRLDERMWILHRQHEVAFHISGIGHEATQVGAAFALKKDTTGCICTIVTLPSR